MELTQEAITSDWKGESLQWGETYLLVDRDTVIPYVSNDSYYLIEFLKDNYPNDFRKYNPNSFDELIELLSDCTTTPEYHVANSNNELTAGSSNDENTEISKSTFIYYNDEDEERDKEIEEDSGMPLSFFGKLF